MSSDGAFEETPAHFRFDEGVAEARIVASADDRPRRRLRLQSADEETHESWT